MTRFNALSLARPSPILLPLSFFPRLLVTALRRYRVDHASPLGLI